VKSNSVNSAKGQTQSALTIPFISSHSESSAVAIKDDNACLTYRELTHLVAHQASLWQKNIVSNEAVFLTARGASARPIVMLFIDNTIQSVIDYLAALSLNFVVLLLNPKCSAKTKAQYKKMLRPNAEIRQGVLSLFHSEPINVDPRLCLLLSTSGSTGASKCVALSLRNITANCNSILSYLPILSDDKTLLTLPLSYSYGLSVLHSHLKAGATVCFTSYSPFDKAFWHVIKQQGINSLSGVPSFYEMLSRLRFTTMRLPELRYFTQAGGKLAESYVKQFANYAHESGKAFYVMYGQTEATARMAYLSPEKVLFKPQSIGQAIAGGEFKLVGGGATEGKGELYYRGENVMLGYVSEVSDLNHLTQEEWLATGDLAQVDDDGDYTITGRIKRMIKIAGERASLDLAEQSLAEITAQQALDLTTCVIGKDDKLVAVFAGELTSAQYDLIVDSLSTSLAIPKRNIALHKVTAIPLLGNGKVDYAKLSGQILGEN
tara:strand:+ start:1572 stop:3044 length:1473 start_codon:yes stop_codon:yes gene_type:complete